MLDAQDKAAEKVAVTHRMGSLTIFVEPTEDGTTWVVPADRIGRWIGEYNEYWIVASGIDNGENLHWCYDRSVTLRGKGIHRQPAEMVKLLKHIQSQELSANWIVSLDEYLQLEPEPRSYFKEVGVNSITLVIDEPEDDRIDADFVESICGLYDDDMNVTMTGYMDRIMASGLLERPELNRTQVSMINRRGSADDKELRLGFRTPCHSRIQLVVGGHGYIYPCLGLAGLDYCVMGHIDDSFDTLFQAGRNPRLDINTWVQDGPDIPEKLEAVVSDGIVLECYFHREALMAEHGS